MGRIVNHLRDRESQRKVAAVAFGRNYFSGHLAYSYFENGKAIVRQVLGDGGELGWHKLKGAWYDGIPLPLANVKFLSGTTPQSGDSSLFDKDELHPGFVIADFTTPDGLTIENNLETNAPDGFRAIAECAIVNDYDASGDNIGDDYSENPARQWMALALTNGKISRDRINWVSWCAWRDYLGGLESVDYSTTGEEGNGITAQFYNGTNFQTLVQKRLDPGINIGNTSGSPAYGIAVDGFSARFEGKLKSPHTGEFKFTVTHDNGTRVWIDNQLLVDKWSDDGLHPSGVQTFTKNLTQNQLYDLKVHWNEGGSVGEMRVEWQCDSANLIKTPIPTTALYPKPEMQPRYTGHYDFPAPTDLDVALKTIERYCNSFTQDANGKISFYCFDNLQPTFTFNETNINLKTFNPSRRDQRFTNLQNRFEARFRDLESQYLDFNRTPLIIDAPELQTLAGRIIDGEPSDFPTMTRWQARKILNRKIKQEVLNDLLADFTGTALTYQVLPGDLANVVLNFAGVNWANKVFQVLRAGDNNDGLLTRDFGLQEWS